MLSEHLESISLVWSAAAPVSFNRRVAKNAKDLIDRIPPPQQVRVVGKLDRIRHSTRSFVLKLGDGSEVRRVLQDRQQVESLREWFGSGVLVLG